MRMRASTIKRLERLEESAKPRIISTMADFVLWCAEADHDQDVELSPELQKFVDETLRHIKEENRASA